MLVGLDVTAASTGATGVARYARELHAGLVRRGVSVRPFSFGRGSEELDAGVARSRIPLRVLHRSWPVLGWPRVETLTGRVDVVHVPDLLPPPTKAPLVVTVHDIVALEHPQLHPARHVLAQRRQVAAAARARVVIAVSQATADALVRRGIAAERIRVTHLGATSLPQPEPRVVEPPYLLAVGEVTPRKGLAMLIEAFRQAETDDEVRLVLAGPPGFGADEVLAATGGRVVALGRVSDGALARLYQDAIALCFPSRAEGFGLPVVEAMSAGLPVLAHDLAVVREVAGDAAILLPLDDVAAWADTLRRVVADAGLRRDLAVAGRARAAVFTWDATVRATLDAYASALR